MVSTHSRAEAAACRHLLGINIRDCFNTQPRGGGCLSGGDLEPLFNRCFNTQPRGGGCDGTPIPKVKVISVSTHSRAEAAAPSLARHLDKARRFNTQPRGGGCFGFSDKEYEAVQVSTHSRAEAAATTIANDLKAQTVSTHSRAEAAASR